MSLYSYSLESLDGCSLKIGSYPAFSYNANGGGGRAQSSEKIFSKNIYLSFDPETFSIPSLSYKTTKIFSLPMPPGLEIKMLMDTLEGTLNESTGYVKLKFRSKFIFSIWPFFVFPNLDVKTSLMTTKVRGKISKPEGEPLDKHGLVTLVGVADVPLTGNKLLDFFLGLPNEALAILKCRIKKIS